MDRSTLQGVPPAVRVDWLAAESYPTADLKYLIVQVLDDGYRKALALPLDRFATTFDLAADNTLRDVQALLMPDAARISARLHKLNVYGPGGFLKSHRVGQAIN